MEEILRIFPDILQQKLSKHIMNRWGKLQEIRLRLNQPVELIWDNLNEWLDNARPTKQEFISIINQLSQFSLYRMEDELREGFITIEGGHRIGLAGKVNTLGGTVKSIQYITFLNIRIAKAKVGAAIPIIPYLYDSQYVNTLIVGAPQTGKTTIIRDVTRLISTGWKDKPAKKVGVIDERSEIAASIKGIPQHNLGKRTDVMDACPKAEGMMMMIRSMSPDILIVDEIGTSKDVEALMEAIHAGVTIICSMHGRSLEEIKRRPSFSHLIEQKIFQRIIILEKYRKPGHIARIYNEDEVNIWKETRCLSDDVGWSTSFDRNNHLDGV
ncbi:stage III sporulation protein AA [Virgibacillus halodenitrificans]|uniref:stage III sporulation protein AA n=1 Tax=Virgibacillus halodenitrificans TaxID=1482 RepID=UPI002DB5F03B|nr:stage III sporulation protein AA [Virgibacillus halodenitrificans]MEC2158406.1 stage III sporulation protein AA [Virgibacillus halodenitrificans]